MHIAFTVDDDIVSAVAAREHIGAGFLQRRPKAGATVALLTYRRQFSLHLIWVDAGLGTAESFPLFRAAFRTLELAVGCQDRPATLEVESDFEFARGLFVDPGGE